MYYYEQDSNDTWTQAGEGKIDPSLVEQSGCTSIRVMFDAVQKLHLPFV